MVLSALPPKADKLADISGCPLCATSGCEQSQQGSPYSITSSAHSRIAVGMPSVHPNKNVRPPVALRRPQCSVRLPAGSRRGLTVATEAQPTNQAKLLVVEDDEMIRMLLADKALHSITSSARSKNSRPIVNPSVLAAATFTTKSNLLGCSMGV